MAEPGMLHRGMDWLLSFRTLQQFAVLYKKNALVAWRNRKATILRMVAPFLFLLLALLIDRALQANTSTSASFQDLQNPQPQQLGSIPKCSDDLYIGTKPCTEILFSPNSTVAQEIISNVTSRNAIRIKAMGFPSQDSIQAYLLANPDSALAAVHFIFDNSTAANALTGFLLQTNTTSKSFKGTYQDPNLFIQMPLQSAVQREIARRSLAPAYPVAAANLTWNVGLVTFPHPAVATVSVLGQVLGPFVFAACMFSFVSQISFLVSEKELGLRQALRTMGMTDTAYWMSWAAWELTLAFFTGHLITIYGLILQFPLFLKNNYGLLFFLFFLFQLSMSSLAMFVCAFLRKTSVAVYVGFGIFLLGWIMQSVIIFGVPYAPDYYYLSGGIITIIFSALPWDLLAKGFTDLGSATVSDTAPGLRWSERSSYCQNIPNVNDQPQYDPRQQYINFQCVMPLSLVYCVFVALWGGYLLLAIYIDNILPNEYGVSRPFYYFLVPSYWFPSRFVNNQLNRINDSMGPSVNPGSVDSDVAEEEAKMRTLLQHRTGLGGDKTELAGQAPGLRNAVELFGLKKVFPHNPCGAWGCCCCCASSKDARAFWALKGSWFGIAENQLFCLLGPNGAGKSTTINCLTGVLPPSNGEALVHGQPITSSGGMDQIRSMMGVCPQFDVLWGELTGAEHLNIYGHVKGVYWRHVNSQCEELLERVKLTYAAKQRTSAYSGGMRRRLSVAIALLGNPKIVYLDEPTTGMDPISRRYVWDIIQEAKVGRAIVLTTHSMEEADILGDRIAIMAKGRLRCIGTSLRLKQKFGSGYQVAVSVVPTTTGTLDQALIAQRSQTIKSFFLDQLGLHPFEEGKVYSHFLVPRDKEAQLMPFLKKLEAKSSELGLTDLQLSLTSLEEVFLNIAKEAELEEARNSGNAKPVEYVLPDGTTLSVPVGEEWVAHPTTAATYKVLWGTDESGNLCILDCKPWQGQTPTQAYAGLLAAGEGAAATATAAGGLSNGGAAGVGSVEMAGGVGGGVGGGAGGGAGRGLGVAVPLATASAGGHADVALPDGTVLRVPAMQQYALNPATNTPYQLTWGVAASGSPVVLRCEPYVPPQPGSTAGAAAPAVPASYFGGPAVGEGAAGPLPLPGAVPMVGSPTSAAAAGRGAAYMK